MVIILDGALMTDREAIHDHLTNQLLLPAYYGRNLDALYDILTERSAPVTIKLTNTALLCGYGRRVLNTIKASANNNPAITLEEKDC